MPVIHVSVDDDTFRTLEAHAAVTGRSVDELAEAAVSNEASKVASDYRQPFVADEVTTWPGYRP